jgi:aldehyde:ferredoxin oxidoreductase
MTAGYADKFLSVDLSRKICCQESIGENILKKWVGGAGLGATILYDRVGSGVGWDSPENVIILASGPLGGTQISGSGTFSVVTKGPMTNGAATSQANAFFGAFIMMNYGSFKEPPVVLKKFGGPLCYRNNKLLFFKLEKINNS